MRIPLYNLDRTSSLYQIDRESDSTVQMVPSILTSQNNEVSIYGMKNLSKLTIQKAVPDLMTTNKETSLPMYQTNQINEIDSWDDGDTWDEDTWDTERMLSQQRTLG